MYHEKGSHFVIERFSERWSCPIWCDDQINSAWHVMAEIQDVHLFLHAKEIAMWFLYLLCKLSKYHENINKKPYSLKISAQSPTPDTRLII